MSWASRRQFKYLSGVILVVALIIFAIIYPYIFKKPTCTDNKQNGDETGIDCGGSCSRMCTADTIDPIVLWSRAFPVTGNLYNLVALVDNQNKNAGIADISYEFRVYDINNKLIGRIQGSTFIAPNKQFAIFEPRFDAGQLAVHSVTFDFIPPFNWVKKEPILNTLDISVDKVVVGSDVNNPTLTARINNDSIYDISSPFDVITILYDANKNAINASKTVKAGIQSNAQSSLIFTWPQKLSGTPVTEDILPQINPFTATF